MIKHSLLFFALACFLIACDSAATQQNAPQNTVATSTKPSTVEVPMIIEETGDFYILKNVDVAKFLNIKDAPSTVNFIELKLGDANATKLANENILKSLIAYCNDCKDMGDYIKFLQTAYKNNAAALAKLSGKAKEELDLILLDDDNAFEHYYLTITVEKFAYPKMVTLLVSQGNSLLGPLDNVTKRFNINPTTGELITSFGFNTSDEIVYKEIEALIAKNQAYHYDQMSGVDKSKKVLFGKAAKEEFSNIVNDNSDYNTNKKGEVFPSVYSVDAIGDDYIVFTYATCIAQRCENQGAVEKKNLAQFLD